MIRTINVWGRNKMIIHHETIPTLKTGRYYLLGNQNYNIKKLWFVFHGYGQLAENFIKIFEPLIDDKTLIVAPEALNKFYLKGYSGDVGSSWMTREDRENEIKDYLIFLNNVYSKIISELYLPKIELNVLGFSQGGPTAVRWLMNKKVVADKLILCGAKLPVDIDLRLATIIFRSTKLMYAIGEKDEFVNAQNVSDEKSKLLENRITAEFVYHDYGHEINRSFVEIIKNKL